MNPAVYNLPVVKRGFSVQSQNLASLSYQSNGEAIPLAFAEIVLKDLNGCVYLTWNTDSGELQISGENSNLVIKKFFNEEITGLWDIGTYTYILKVKTMSGETWPTLIGTMKVE
jgi:hypothetical protein